MKAARPRLAPAIHNVAVYARQSVEDTRSAFGSIDAQRDAVSAYITSQAERGWRASATDYTDAGFSGATLNRPGLKRLLADVDAGLVQVVAVYRFDRLSRSQMGFLSTIEHLRERGVAFVSVTEAIDTATIAGRAMLGILAVFAEMERAVISERTRDKINAARRRGLWTGGPRVLGYDLIDSKLVVNEAEATIVRALFDTYLERRSIMATLDVTRTRAWRMKGWTTHENRTVEPRDFTKSTLRSLLANPVYVGLVRLNGETFPGVHDAIVSRELFDAVQNALVTAPPEHEPGTGNRHAALLRDLIACAVCGAKMRVAATRGHLSYVCGRAVTQGASACPGSRIPATTIETAVLDRIRAIGTDPLLVDATIASVADVRAEQIADAVARVRALEGDRARLERERDRLLGAVGGASNATVLARLDAISTEVAEISARVAAANADTERLRSVEVDEAELRALLADFEPLWDALFQSERERLLGLLVTQITYDGRSGEVTIHAAGDA